MVPTELLMELRVLVGDLSIGQAGKYTHVHRAKVVPDLCGESVRASDGFCRLDGTQRTTRNNRSERDVLTQHAAKAYGGGKPRSGKRMV